MRVNNIVIKWAGPNTPYVKIEREEADQRLYPTKQELLDLQKAINQFVEAYSDDFTGERLQYEDTGWDIFEEIRDAGC